MKRFHSSFLLCILSALLALGTIASADELSIRSVDLYPSGAKFVFAVAAGPNGFELELPGAFQAGSVRLLNPKDAADLKVVQGSRANWTPPALADLKEQVEAQERAVSLLNARKASLEQTQDILKSVRPKEADAAGLLTYIQETQTLKLDVEEELVEVNAGLKKENEKLKLLRSELSERTPQNAGAFIRVTGRPRTDQPLLIEAMTPAARWYPRYTMDLDAATGAIQTQMYARAVQRTGLDYAGPVTFHTKYPDEAVRAPVLDPLRVSLRPKEQPRASRRAAQESAMADMAYAPPMAMMKNAGFAQAPMEAMDEDVALESVMEATMADRIVRGAGKLEGDGREAEFVLGELQLTGKPLLVVIPEQRDNAWIVVSMDHIATPLIPGTASLRVDRHPAGTTSLPEYGLGQTRIPFGYAPQITAKKEPLIEKTGSSWFSGVFTSGYTLEVTNGMKEEKVITIRDRLPIPTDEKIKLEVKRIDPQPKERDKENRLTWELPVKPGETVKIVVDYALSYPSGEELQYR